MTDRELMEMALWALGIDCKDANGNKIDLVLPAIQALRDRLAQPEPEPVAWIENLTDPQPHAVTDLKYCSVADRDSGKDLTYIPLYTAPPKREWVGLTDEEVMLVMDDVLEGGGWLDIARAIEAKLKEKNSG